MNKPVECGSQKADFFVHRILDNTRLNQDTSTLQNVVVQSMPIANRFTLRVQQLTAYVKDVFTRLYDGLRNAMKIHLFSLWLLPRAFVVQNLFSRHKCTCNNNNNNNNNSDNDNNNNATKRTAAATQPRCVQAMQRPRRICGINILRRNIGSRRHFVLRHHSKLKLWHLTRMSYQQ